MYDASCTDDRSLRTRTVWADAASFRPPTPGLTVRVQVSFFTDPIFISLDLTAKENPAQWRGSSPETREPLLPGWVSRGRPHLGRRAASRECPAAGLHMAPAWMRDVGLVGLPGWGDDGLIGHGSPPVSFWQPPPLAPAAAFPLRWGYSHH